MCWKNEHNKPHVHPPLPTRALTVQHKSESDLGSLWVVGGDAETWRMLLHVQR